MFYPQKSEALAHLPPLQREVYCYTMQVQIYKEIPRLQQAHIGILYINCKKTPKSVFCGF